MKTLSRKEIKEQYQDLIEFKHSFTEYKRNSNVRDYLNKIFCSKIKAAFIDMEDRVESKENMNKYGFGWDGHSIILINEKEEVIILSNSEWATFSVLKD